MEISGRVIRMRIYLGEGDMPMVVEIVDEAEKIEAFRPVLAGMMESCGRGGMVTLGDIEVIHYQPGKK